MKQLVTVIAVFLTLSCYAQHVGDQYKGGVVYRSNGKHGMIVKQIRDSVSFEEALKICDTLSIGSKGWRLPSGSDWMQSSERGEIFPGITQLKENKQFSLSGLYYWMHDGTESSKTAHAIIASGDYSFVAFPKTSRIGMVAVHAF